MNNQLSDEHLLVSALISYSKPFGIPIVQRLTGWGYERSRLTIERLESKGVVDNCTDEGEWILIRNDH